MYPAAEFGAKVDCSEPLFVLDANFYGCLHSRSTDRGEYRTIAAAYVCKILQYGANEYEYEANCE